MPGRMPQSFKPMWEKCVSERKAAIAAAAQARADKKAIVAAKKRVDEQARKARAEVKAAHQHEVAAKREAASARKAAREANRGVAGPGELGFARYLREKAAPKAATPVARRTRARKAAAL